MVTVHFDGLRLVAPHLRPLAFYLQWGFVLEQIRV
jgi:hypothetical protein